MLPIIKKAFASRKRLIKDGKSKLDCKWALQFIKNYEYWDAQAKNSLELALKKIKELLIIAPPSFVEELKKIVT